MGEPVQIDFDPALDGRIPELRITPLKESVDFEGEILITAYAWEGKEIVLKTETISNKEDYTMSLPTRGKSEILGVRIELLIKEEAESKKIAEWRTMYFPESRALDYEGSPNLERPGDFARYWNEAKEKLALAPMNPIIEAVPEKDSATGRLYKVTINSYLNLPIVCWYFVPKDVDPLSTEDITKHYPAIQLMPGWGAEEPPADYTAEGYITLALNPRSHGPSKEYFKTPIEHHLWNIDMPEDYYYRAAYMDCRRGIDFLVSRPEVDCARIGVIGGSQGGAFALSLGSLDTRVACVATNVPYLVNFPDFSELATLGSGPIFMHMAHRDDIGFRVRQTLGYIDIANLAPDIRVPTQVCVGLQDPVCPPLGGIVVINRIPDGVPKRLVIDKEAEHENSPMMYEENMKWFKKYLQEDTAVSHK